MCVCVCERERERERERAHSALDWKRGHRIRLMPMEAGGLLAIGRLDLSPGMGQEVVGRTSLCDATGKIILLLLSVLERAPEREKDDRGWGARCCDALAAGADKIAGESDWYPLQLYSYIFNCLESKKFETNCKKPQTSSSINIST
jgi:hypothetical protein